MPPTSPVMTKLASQGMCGGQLKSEGQTELAASVLLALPQAVSFLLLMLQNQMEQMHSEVDYDGHIFDN
jgi:hypothetical protein